MLLNINTSRNVQNPKPNFKSAYTIKNVTINGKNYSSKHRDTVYKIAKELSSAMYKKTLSGAVMEKVYKLFPDFKKFQYATLGCSRRKDMMVNILAGNDAQMYRNVFLTNELPEDRRMNGFNLLLRILKFNGFQKLAITAEERNGSIIIKDIEKINC